MSDLVLLDFDGVINALTRKPMRSAYSEWESTQLLGFPILYAREVIDAVNAVSSKPHVTVRWLTTWEAATTELTALGLDNFDYIPPLPDFTGDLRIGDWKPAAGLTVAESWPGTVIWIDDDTWIEQEVTSASRPNITFLRPTPSLGLSKKQLRLLDEFTTP